MGYVMPLRFFKILLHECLSIKFTKGALGGGKFKTEEQLKQYQETGEKTRDLSMRGGVSEKAKAITVVLDNIAKRKGSTVTGIALSYVMQKVNIFLLMTDD